MAETYKAEEILHTYADSWGMGEDHPDYPEYQAECQQIDTALDILSRAPSNWLIKNTKALAENLSDHQIFFSEDGKTALIVDEVGDNTFFVRLTKDEYATAGGKLFWATINLHEVANK